MVVYFAAYARENVSYSFHVTGLSLVVLCSCFSFQRFDIIFRRRLFVVKPFSHLSVLVVFLFVVVLFFSVNLRFLFLLLQPESSNNINYFFYLIIYCFFVISLLKHTCRCCVRTDRGKRNQQQTSVEN